MKWAVLWIRPSLLLNETSLNHVTNFSQIFTVFVEVLQRTRFYVDILWYATFTIQTLRWDNISEFYGSIFLTAYIPLSIKIIINMILNLKARFFHRCLKVCPAIKYTNLISNLPVIWFIHLNLILNMWTALSECTRHVIKKNVLKNSLNEK